MDDEPDIIKELRIEEKSGFNAAKPKNPDTKLQKYPPIEPDYGGVFRKAFAIVVVIILIVAGVLFYVSAAFRETNWILKAEQAKFIGTWEVTDNYYYDYSSRITWHFYENKTLKTTNYYSNTNYYGNLECPTISFTQDSKNKSLAVTDINMTNSDISSYDQWGAYYIGGGKLHLKENPYSDYESYSYSFSLNNTRIELTSEQSYYDKILTKSQGFIITSEVMWENINITLRSSGSPRYDLISFDNCSFCDYNGYSAPSVWGNVSIGDYITFGDFEYDTYVDFRYLPCDQVICGFYFPSDDQTMRNDLVAYWDFEDTSEGILYDKSGNKNHGTIYGSTSVPGVDGFGLSFDGHNDYVKFGSPVITTAPYSICCWAKPDSIPYSNKYILANGGESSRYNGFYLNIETSGTFDANYTFGVNDGLASGYASYHLDSTDLVFLCGTWDGSADASNLKLYVNGELKSTGVLSSPSTAPLNNLHIGCPSTYVSYIFEGLIDEVRIYNRVLTPTEIQEIYNNI